MQSLRIQLQKKLATFDELNEMEYAWSLKQRQFIFFSDVFVAVAFVGA